MAQSTLSDVADGAFKRPASVFRDKIQAGGAHPPAAGRYTLYVSYACPWASRCLAFRRIKGLEKAIALAVVSPVWAKTRPDVDDHEGWIFDPSFDSACTADPLGQRTARDLYDLSIRNSGQDPAQLVTRYTVPILFDNVTGTIVNNESSEIIRMFNDEFNEFAELPEVDLAPPHLRSAIDDINSLTYEDICNGVYKCGFARSQAAYDVAVTSLFKRLDEVDALLATRRYLVDGSSSPTEADVRLFVCLVRFDEVYVVHFKCNKRAIREYPNLYAWLRDVYQTLSLAPTVNMKHIKDHYYRSHTSINTYGIVPIGSSTIEQLDAPHGRDRPYHQ